ncbi:DUF4190 domain-containing protein [Leucobacter sp. gxy201]|uniref:DUF4190 domain-containing protein n=1 Tax=Leucobacter sp. gxy201 TaxID=2957200 RepID=UPI003D9FD8E4
MTTTAVTAILPDQTVELELQNRSAAPDASVAPAPAPAPAATQTPAADESRASSFALASFVIGIVSIAAGWSLFVPIVGFVLGMLALRRGTAERTLALWGVWLNGVLLALVAIAIVAVIAVVGFGLIALPLAAS